MNIRNAWRPRLLTIVYALIGVALFSVLSLPLPWLLGPMVACLAAAACRAPLKGIPAVSEAMRTVLGVAVGASITPALFHRLDDMALSLMLVPVFIVLIGLVGVPYFSRLCGFDRVTSFYAAMPGGFQDMVLFGEEAGGNVRALSLIHATRVFVVVFVVPFLLAWVWDRDLIPTVITNDPFDRLSLAFGKARSSKWYGYHEMIATMSKSQGEPASGG